MLHSRKEIKYKLCNSRCMLLDSSVALTPTAVSHSTAFCFMWLTVDRQLWEGLTGVLSVTKEVLTQAHKQLIVFFYHHSITSAPECLST